MPIAPGSVPSTRILALDWARGVVMVLMPVDHASMAFYQSRIVVDAPYLYHPGMPLPAVPFFLRWITYVCAPMFFVLSGTSLALTLARRTRAQAPPWKLDQYLITRGAILIALDAVWMSLAFETTPGDTWIQVLGTMGVLMILMVPLRRIPASWLLGAVAVLVVALEWLGARIDPDSNAASVLFLGGTFSGRSIFDGTRSLLMNYPLAPWLCFFVLGWCFGGFVSRWDATKQGLGTILRVTLGVAAGGLAGFLVVRGMNGYGNAGELRDGDGLIQWLNVSSEPPSLSHMALTLGLIGGILAIAFHGEHARWFAGRLARWLIVFGQSALFFYLLHIHLLVYAARALGLEAACGLAVTLVAMAATLLALNPLCARYHAYRVAHPRSWTRFF